MEDDKNLNGEMKQDSPKSDAQKPAQTDKPKASDREDKPGFSGWLGAKVGEYKGEFRKIMWPSRKELQKKSITVVITSLLFAALIFGIDSAYNLCIELLLRIFG